MPNRLLLKVAENKKLEALASRNRFARPIVDRYVAGNGLEDAWTATAALNRAGIDVSLDLLGESVHHLAQSKEATQEYQGPLRTSSTARQAPRSRLSCPSLAS